jgi:hypothetical protein
MKARWKILLAVAVCMMGSVAAWLTTTHTGLESEVEVYKKVLRDKGEKLEISEVLPPPVAPESNGVNFVEQAFSLFIPANDDESNLPPAMRMVAPGKAMVCSQQPEVRGSDFTNSWENVNAAAETSRPVNELLNQAAAFPAIDFQLDYQAGPDMTPLHLAPLRRCAQRLSAAAICDLHNGDAASATTNLCTLLALVRADHDERTLISQLIRIAMASIAITVNWEILQSTNVTDGELAALQRNWEQIEFTEAVGNSFLMERAFTENDIKKMRDSQEVLNRYAGGFGYSSGGGSGDWLDSVKDYWDHAKYTASAFMWRTSWSYSDELRTLKADQIILETVRAFGTNQDFNPA